jgi:adenylosuccinate synthase
VPGIIVVGSQWGDEGKGKVIDVFSAQADYVVRYQGGANAGHTLVVNGIKTVLHLVPSGILHPKTTCVIAAGVVLDLEEVVNEIRSLKEAGMITNPDQLKISDQATVLLSYHRAIDQAREKALGQEKIGTTGRGIGPAYEDRASRKAILFGDLFDESKLRAKLDEALQEKNFLLKEYYKVEPINADHLFGRMMELTKELTPYRCKDASMLVHKAIKDHKKVLFEGAQGTMLDILHGSRAKDRRHHEGLHDPRWLRPLPDRNRRRTRRTYSPRRRRIRCNNGSPTALWLARSRGVEVCNSR